MLSSPFSVNSDTSCGCCRKGGRIRIHIIVNIEVAHAATKAALDVLGDVGDPAAAERVPLLSWAGNADSVGDGLVAVGDILGTAAAGTVVSAVDELGDVVFASAVAPVVVSLLVVHDLLVVFCHLLHLLVLFGFTPVLTLPAS